MSFNTKLTDLLKTDSRFVDDESELIIAAVQDRAWKIDHDLVKLLLSDKEIKAKFFDEIEGHWIFNLNTFIDYISQKNFLDNSYTRFRNRIGLTIGDNYLRERGDVAIVWPYKDTVLEGGQTKEEEKRKEIFFNEVLAQDEINRLLDPKVLTNFARFTVKGKQPVKDFKRDENGVIRENLIIKGNNLLALHTLKTQFRGQVKLIYIDPPYYFKDDKPEDTFKYNTNFKLSTWLTFMKNRLRVAKELLSDEGVIFVQIKDDGMAHLKLLMDEVFEDGFVNCIAVKMSEASGVKMSHAKKRFPNIKEYILFYKKTNKFNGFYKIDKYENKEWDKENNIFLENFTKEQREKLIEIEEKEEIAVNDVEKAIKILNKVKKVPLKEKLKSLNKDIDQAEWLFENSYRIIKTAGSSSLAKQVLELTEIPNQDISAFTSRDGILCYYITDFNRNTDTPRLQVLFADTAIWKNPCDFWQDIKTTGAIAKERGVQLSGGKKPEKLIQRIIDMTTQKGDIVLDYHSGSGTTASVAHKMSRQWITCEQIDNQIELTITGMKNVINGDQTGITKAVKWQGGGDFIYCELMKYNEDFMERIQAAKSSKELLKIWQEMAEGSFLNWYVNPEMPEEAVKDFEALGKEPNGLEKQKRLLAELLDKNQLYVNLSEIDDAQFKVSKEDKALNRAFYGEASNA